ncbi:hypothetical protein EP30_09485 [Bifidobacterium sp. UTCIF-39]|nr:hypothetical protein EP30_09485 [Bifidobacterium sp. UTCIF-39]
MDLSLQLPIVVGCTAECRPYIMLLCSMRPEPLDSLDVLDVRVAKRQSPIGENWSLMFILKDWSLLHAFAEICLAFIARIRRSPSQRAALREVYATLDQWRRLLKTNSGTGMEILRGVCGELLAAFEIAKLTGSSIDAACAAWTGPYGSPQDYSFESERRYWEIKTVHGNTKKIKISSPEQLDTSDRHIDLITVVLDEPTSADKKRLVNLPKILRALSFVSNDPYRMGLCIDNGLDALGLDRYSDLAAHTMFSVGTVTVYAVDEDFPHMSVETVPAGITKLTYEVEIAVIKPFITGIDINPMPVLPEE